MQRFHSGDSSGDPSRVLDGELRHDAVHPRLRLVNGDAVAEPGDGVEVIAKFVAADARVRRGDERYPDLNSLGRVGGLTEIGRHHADNLE